MTSPARSGLVSRSTSHRSAVLALSWLLVPFFVAGGMLSSLRLRCCIFRYDFWPVHWLQLCRGKLQLASAPQPGTSAEPSKLVSLARLRARM